MQGENRIAGNMRVLIADSHPLIRQGIQSALEKDEQISIVGEVEQGQEAVRSLRRLKPDVGIIELDLPSVDGLHILSSMAREGIKTRVVLLSSRCGGSDVYNAVREGAIGYLSDKESVSNIRRAVNRAAEGKSTFSKDAEKALREYLRNHTQNVPQPEDSTPRQRPLLTHRELEVLHCLARGQTIETTSENLNMSDATVKNHRHAIYSKLGVPNAPAAVYQAVQKNYLE